MKYARLQHLYVQSSIPYRRQKTDCPLYRVPKDGTVTAQHSPAQPMTAAVLSDNVNHTCALRQVTSVRRNF